MKNLLAARIANLLPAEDRSRVEALNFHPRRVPAREDICPAGRPPGEFKILAEGFACRYKLMPGGRRSITAFLLPGDFCDLQVSVLKHTDHGVMSLSPCVVAETSRAAVEGLFAYPRIALALWRACLEEEQVLREWLTQMGRNSSDRQLAHLLCELRVRLVGAGMASEKTFRLPLTQEELGDAVGITTVHVNRVLQQLRESGLVRIVDRMVMIPDIARLEEFADFDGTYLGAAQPAAERAAVG